MERDFTGLVQLFQRAGQRLKYPKIRLQLPNGRPVCLSVAGAKARLPGTINVTDGGPYGDNTWYGRVLPDTGAWQPARDTSLNAAADIGLLLGDLARDPVRTAARHGQLTGNCCFCSLPLSDPRSTAIGYGRVCARNFNLPWGASVAEPVLKREEAA